MNSPEILEMLVAHKNKATIIISLPYKAFVTLVNCYRIILWINTHQFWYQS